jgi:hypothetical protein
MRSRILATTAFFAVAAVTACSGAHKQPTGPAPEYEDPPPPSWLKDGGAAPPPAPAALPIDPVPTPPAATPIPVGGGNS